MIRCLVRGTRSRTTLSEADAEALSCPSAQPRQAPAQAAGGRERHWLASWAERNPLLFFGRIRAPPRAQGHGSVRCGSARPGEGRRGRRLLPAASAQSLRRTAGGQSELGRRSPGVCPEEGAAAPQPDPRHTGHEPGARRWAQGGNRRAPRSSPIPWADRLRSPPGRRAGRGRVRSAAAWSPRRSPGSPDSEEPGLWFCTETKAVA